ncbi:MULTISPECIES: DUF6084 family protein [unclassified Pseudofrankia]|uniref:DUF6084 family protein n=1 Tax=unclassified Pseudofrankia TaxID=2994372 RepID=UPI0009F67727|nr:MULTISPECIES: DUF6084 family protein [unclassified Pseudofrankia]MDT3440242.1 DUF6084 family protein [Pseudofrankia sp. BMG5.37]
MAEFAFNCLDIAPMPCGASPTLVARLRIAETTGASIQAIALRCQVRVEPSGRGYRDDEREQLWAVFGGLPRWSHSMRSFPVATVSAMVGSFVGSVGAELHIPVSYDLEVAAGKYFHTLRDGVIPLSLLFSGTVFRSTLAGPRVEPVPWHLEAHYRLPVAVWRQLMDAYFPGEAWMRLRRGTVDAVARYKMTNALPTWDDAILALLAAAGATTGPSPAEQVIADSPGPTAGTARASDRPGRAADGAAATSAAQDPDVATDRRRVGS